MQASPAVIFARFRGFHVQQLHRVFAVRSPLKRLRNRDRMCNRITAHARRYDYHLVRASPRHPDTPHQCVSAQCGFRFSSASSPTRSLTFGRWGCGERCHLSHVVGDSAVVLSGMSRQIALQTRSEALRRTRRGLNARQGMEGAKNAYRAFQEVRRADTPSQGLSGRQEPRQPPAKPICTVQAVTRLVGGRRPSVLQRWGSGVLPRRFPVALKALPEPWRLGRSGDRGAKTRKGF